MSKSIKGKLILLLASVVWGFAFVAQNQVADYVGPFTLNAIRCFIGALSLIPVIAIKDKIEKKKEVAKKPLKPLIFSGVLCGILLCIAVNLQQFGIASYGNDVAVSGRSGFITALYVVLVPIFSLLFHKKLHLNGIIGVIIAIIGMYFLCLSEGIDRLYIGDLIIFLCAIGFSFQIILIDKYSNIVDGIKLSFLEFFVCSFLSMILMFIFEKPSIDNILKCIVPILYLGIFSSGVGYTLQIVGQSYSKNPTIDSIIMSFESVFAAIGGLIILNEILSFKEVVGCTLMFVAIIISQLPENLLKRRKNNI